MNEYRRFPPGNQFFQKTSILNDCGLKIIEFERVGYHPKSLFISGIHGDEDGSIGRLRQILNNNIINNYSSIGDHLRIFRSNEEAIINNLRGINNIDQNRTFSTRSNRKKADHNTRERTRKIKKILKDNPNINYIFSFHEETDDRAYIPDHNPDTGLDTVLDRRRLDSFYMYDTPGDDTFDIYPLFSQLISALKQSGFSSYTGLDDFNPNDPHQTVQGNMVVDGYCFQGKNTLNDGTFENYFVRVDPSKKRRSFVFEIPSRLSVQQKQQMIEIIFSEFIIPFLAQRNHS